MVCYAHLRSDSQQARTYLYHLSAETECSSEDLLG